MLIASYSTIVVCASEDLFIFPLYLDITIKKIMDIIAIAVTFAMSRTQNLTMLRLVSGASQYELLTFKCPSYNSNSSFLERLLKSKLIIDF